MERRNWAHVSVGCILVVVSNLGCSRELVDAVVSGAATFIEAQTLEILNEAFGVDSEE